MTNWEQHIAGIFIERYPRSTASEGGRPLRLSLGQLFPEFEKSGPDEKESFLEAAEALEKKCLVSVRWVRLRKKEMLASMTFRDPEALYALAGQASPSLTAAAARQAAHEAAAGFAAQSGSAGGSSTAADSAAAHAELFAFIAENIKSSDAVTGIDSQAVKDLARLTEYASGNPGTNAVTPRAVSIALYSDSKRLEALTALFTHIFVRAKNKEIAVPDFSFLDRSFPETMIAGKLQFVFDTHENLNNAEGIILGLPLTSILRFREIKPLSIGSEAVSTVLMIENKETFYALAERRGTILAQYDAFLYTAGYPNRAVCALVSLLAASGFALYHAGDLDVDGILIVQELAGAAGKPVIPVRMDGKTFDEYRHFGRPLKKSTVRRTALIHEPLRNLPGIAELIERIEKNALGVEQEIIDYR
jgi:hypothetical protein